MLVKVRRLLAPNGLLFVGPAELPLAANNGFAATNASPGFRLPQTGFAAQINARKPCAEEPAASWDFGTARSARRGRRHGPRTSRGLEFDFARPAQPPQQLADLEEVRELALAGCLHEAAAICEAHLRLYGVSAEAFYLLGLIRDYSGADSLRHRILSQGALPSADAL